MKVKPREASCSALRMGQGSSISDDSPHRPAYLPQLLSSRRTDHSTFREALLSDDEDPSETLKKPSQPLCRSSSLILPEPDETAAQEVEFLQDYERPLKGGKSRSKKKSKRRKNSKKKQHGKSEKDNHHVHCDLYLSDCGGVQTPMSEVSMDDDWFEDMYQAQQLSYSSSLLLGNLPGAEAGLTASSLEAVVLSTKPNGWQN